MTEILLVRHCKSYANDRDPAFGNEKSPLNEDGKEAAVALGKRLHTDHGIDPTTYEQAVLSSEFKRPMQTAELAGFRYIDVHPILNEAALPSHMLCGRQIIEKHARERWIPEDLSQRAQRFVDLIRQNDLGYHIYFTHGFFIAAVLTELDSQHDGTSSPYRFDVERGYIPSLGTITLASV